MAAIDISSSSTSSDTACNASSTKPQSLVTNAPTAVLRDVVNNGLYLNILYQIGLICWTTSASILEKQITSLLSPANSIGSEMLA